MIELEVYNKKIITKDLLEFMISITELRQAIESQYSTKCFVNLVELSLSPTKAYTHLQSCYQSSFDNNDRLVFYTSDHISDSFLQHLYQACNLIDISNFFVLICSPYELDSAVITNAQKVSTDPVPFQWYQVDIEPTGDLQFDFAVPEKLCPMPWMNLEIDNHGNISPCCAYSNGGIAHVNNSTLNQAFYNNQMSHLRQQFLDGMQPSGCKKCWDLEDRGLISIRTYNLGLLKKELLTNYIDDLKIRSLDLKPGNTCNFKCRICTPKSSSLYEQEFKKIKNITFKTPNWAEDTPVVIDEITQLLPNLTNIDMYGGEPFLIKPVLRLVKQAAESGYSHNIRLHFNSNGSIYPEHHIKYWKNFKHIDIQFSIDNVGKRFELERGGSWDQVAHNIQTLVDLNLPNVNISIMPAISIMNIFYIDELLHWADNLNLSVNPLYVTTPNGFALTNLTANAKKTIVNKFKDHPWLEMKNILSYIQSLPDSDGREFLKLCKHFDSIRRENFLDSHFEIAEAMGYVYNSKL